MTAFREAKQYNNLLYTVLPYSQVVNNLGGRGCVWGGGLSILKKLLNREVKKKLGKQIEKGGGWAE